MKKISIISLLFFLFFATGTTLSAAPVPAERALEIGKKILAAQPATKSGTGQIGIVWDGESGDAATKSNLSPAFYVVARDGGGFVIIAGDDNAHPVLAISDRNEFKVDEMPANVKWWMERMKTYVRSLKSQSPEAADRWERLVATKGMVDDGTSVDVKASHFTPEWGQGFVNVIIDDQGTICRAPLYNAKCPVDAAGDTTVTGCVATALAEILTAQSAIDGVTIPSPTGTVGGYATSAGVAPAAYSLDGHTYLWPFLQYITNWQYIFFEYLAWLDDSAQNPYIEDLWQLMADLGAIVEAEYSTESTGASSGFVPSAMAEHFGFNPNAHLEYADQYTPSRWVTMLQNEISQRPVFYSGVSPSEGGHAFVFDAFGTFQGDDVFHVNFGWNGSCNGYYYYYDLDVGGSDFANEASAIFDFYPGGSTPSGEYAYRLSLTDAAGGTGFVVPASIPVGEKFYLVVNTIMNTGTSPFVGSVVPVLKKGNGDIYILDPTDMPELPVGAYFRGAFPLDDCEIPSGTNLEFGDRIVLYYTCDGTYYTCDGTYTGAIKPMSYPADGSFLGELPIFPMSFIATEDFYSVGDYFTFALKNNSCLYANSVWTITKPDGTTEESIPQSRGDYQLTQSGKYKIKVDVIPDESSGVIETIVASIIVN